MVIKEKITIECIYAEIEDDEILFHIFVTYHQQ